MQLTCNVVRRTSGYQRYQWAGNITILTWPDLVAALALHTYYVSLSNNTDASHSFTLNVIF